MYHIYRKRTTARSTQETYLFTLFGPGSSSQALRLIVKRLLGVLLDEYPSDWKVYEKIYLLILIPTLRSTKILTSQSNKMIRCCITKKNLSIMQNFLHPIQE